MRQHLSKMTIDGSWTLKYCRKWFHPNAYAFSLTTRLSDGTFNFPYVFSFKTRWTTHRKPSWEWKLFPFILLYVIIYRFIVFLSYEYINLVSIQVLIEISIGFIKCTEAGKYFFLDTTIKKGRKKLEIYFYWCFSLFKYSKNSINFCFVKNLQFLDFNCFPWISLCVTLPRGPTNHQKWILENQWHCKLLLWCI